MAELKSIVAKNRHKVANYRPEEIPTGERWVAMSNAIVRSAQGLSLPEKQIIMLAVSKLDSRKFHGKDNLPRVRLSAAEMIEAYGINQSDAYKYLKQAGDHLYERSLVLREQAHDRAKSGRGSGEMVMRCRWIGSQKYHDGEGWMEMVFWPEIVPHLTALKVKFTEYQMKQVATLRSNYSWRLLELLMQFAGTDKRNPNGTVVIEIGDFHHAMETAESQRENFAFLRRRVIEPAVKELADKDGWLIEWKPIKAGRRVAKLQFRFAKNPQPQLPFDPQENRRTTEPPLTSRYDLAKHLTTEDFREAYLAEAEATGDESLISKARETVERAKRLAAGRSDQSGL